MTEQHTRHTTRIPDELAGQRLDQALARLFPDYSRSRLKAWLLDGAVLVDGIAWRPRDRVQGGETVDLTVTPEAVVRAAPEAMALDVVFEDDDLLVINKPAGLVVHPGAGNVSGTLMNGLLAHAAQLESMPRAGIIHRLDKDTTGLMVVAASIEAHTVLTRSLAAREILREYQAIACGVMTAGGKVSAPIGRSSADRRKMTVRAGGRPSVTHYRVIERFRSHTHIRLNLETGRTHQIRVHMAHLRYPLVGDPVYGGRLRIPAGASEEFGSALRGFHRQALHAARLGFEHPVTGEAMEWSSELPQDMVDLLAQLREDAKVNKE